MNSALKPVLPQPGVPQPGGQASPAKGNVASANHAVGLPQGAQNSLHHGSNSLVGQNLIHHVNAPQPPVHAVPSMAPVTANMAQMAQNMSHHGNLSHVTQNSIPPPSPSKTATTGAPLSLVQEKANSSQPLALTRTPEKKEPDSSSHANGTIESSKSGSNAPTPLKPQNPECNKDKQDIAKTSPSTPKPPEKSLEKLANTQCTPQKSDAPNSVAQPDGPVQPKVATANEPPEKSPSKPTDVKLAPTADVAPVQSDSKPTPEAANENQDKVSTSQVQEQRAPESPKADSPSKSEEKKVEPSEKPQQVEEKKEEVKEIIESSKQEEETEKLEKQEEKVEEKKPEVKTPVKPEVKLAPKSTMKLATVTPPMRKRRQLSPTKSSDGITPAKKSLDADSTVDTRIKRNRTKVQLYQSPTPEIAMATKLSASAGRSTPTKPNDDKLIVFYKNEYLAVRNAEGGFYVCQAVQNVYRSTRKIKIRWLSQDKADPSGETYVPDFYDVTDMECVLTTLSLSRAPGGGGAQLLKATEEARAKSILDRALKAEQSGDANNLELTEEHPDGLDLSLYTDESQLEKKGRKRSGKSSPRTKSDQEQTAEEETPSKKARSTPKRSPKGSRKSKPKQSNNKTKSTGSSPVVAAASKTATAVTDKTKAKLTPAKRTPAKPLKAETPLSTPTRKGRRAAKDIKASPMTPTPSTSTGKATRTPRKPPAKK